MFFTALNGRAFLNSVTSSKTGVWKGKSPIGVQEQSAGGVWRKVSRKLKPTCTVKSVDRANFILFWGCITRFSVAHIKFTELILSTVNLSCGCYNFECFSIAIDRFMLW